MPLYEYQCQSCQDRTEVIRKFSDPPLTECPKCGGELRKLVSSPAIQFKGSGFYITDYGRAGSSGDKSSESGGGKSDSSSTTADSTSTAAGGNSSPKKSDDSK